MSDFTEVKLECIRGVLVALLATTGLLHAEAPNFEAMNGVLDKAVWIDDNLWDDPASEVAKRLDWAKESETSFDLSFRKYAGRADRVLGARPFSLALYGAANRTDQLSMVFANKGDISQMVQLESGASEREVERANSKMERDYKKFIIADEATISARLKEALGEPATMRFGDGRTSERVKRWDWKGHTILLAAPRGEYVSVRILPTSVAEGETAARVTDAELKDQLASRVERRPNGDVILRDIPMVNQGQKGYCVPATWERALRYLGIPADMYVLAMAGSSDVGGGTSVESMMMGVSDIVRRNGRRITMEGGRLTTQSVARTIDRGLPLLWSMVSMTDINESINGRTLQRKSVTDWAAYQEMLKPQRAAARRIRKDLEESHVCMIIGYNEKTGELAVSDSWGPEYAERWITEEEANAISLGELVVVQW